MKIEKGQVFVLQESPKIVGVVVGVQDSRRDSWKIKATDGLEVSVWNNASQSWRGNLDYLKPSEETLLVPNEDTSELVIEVDSDTAPKDINIGQLWTVVHNSTDAEFNKVLILDEMYDIEPIYKAIVYFEDGTTSFTTFDRYGISTQGIDIQLDEVYDTLFGYEDLF